MSTTFRTVTIRQDATSGRWHVFEADGTRLPLNRDGYASTATAWAALSLAYLATAEGEYGANIRPHSDPGQSGPRYVAAAARMAAYEAERAAAPAPETRQDTCRVYVRERDAETGGLVLCEIMEADMPLPEFQRWVLGGFGTGRAWFLAAGEPAREYAFSAGYRTAGQDTVWPFERHGTDRLTWSRCGAPIAPVQPTPCQPQQASADDRDAAWRASRPDAGGALAAVRPATDSGEAWPGRSPIRDSYAPAAWPAATAATVPASTPLPCHLIPTPSGRFVFTGRVPQELACEASDPSYLEAARRSGPGIAARIAAREGGTFRSLSWSTEAEAYAAAAALGYTVPAVASQATPQQAQQPIAAPAGRKPLWRVSGVRKGKAWCQDVRAVDVEGAKVRAREISFHPLLIESVVRIDEDPEATRAAAVAAALMLVKPAAVVRDRPPTAHVSAMIVARLHAANVARIAPELRDAAVVLRELADALPAPVAAIEPPAPLPYWREIGAAARAVVVDLRSDAAALVAPIPPLFESRTVIEPAPEPRFPIARGVSLPVKAPGPVTVAIHACEAEFSRFDESAATIEHRAGASWLQRLRTSPAAALVLAAIGGGLASAAAYALGF